MKTLATGKDAVLAYLEEIASKRAGKPGAYRIFGDDSGGAEVLIIAGLTFSGSHTLPSSLVPSEIAKLRVENGIIVEIGDN